MQESNSRKIGKIRYRLCNAKSVTIKGLHKAMNIIYNRKERIVDNHV